MSLVDSIDVYDTGNLSFKILKAYANDDTAFLNRMIEGLEIALKMGRHSFYFNDSCGTLPKLSRINADEAYRFHLSESLCHFKQLVTITREVGVVNLHFMEYSPGAPDSAIYTNAKKDTFFVKPYCVIQREIKRSLTTTEWEEFKNKIEVADFWGLKESNPPRPSFDGSSWTVEGYTKDPRYVTNQQFHFVSRANPRNPAFIELGKYFLNLSGGNTLCDPIR